MLETADIAPMAREPWPSELTPYAHQFAGDMMKEPLLVRVATSGFAPDGQVGALGAHLNATNPLRQLSLAQLDAIFSATRKRGAAAPHTWGDLGLGGEWAARPIVRVTLPAHSGAAMFAQRRVLLGGWWHPDLDEQPTPAAVMREIAATPGAIGLAEFSAAPFPGTRALALSEGDTGPFIAAREETVENHTYPLTRALYLAVNKRPDSALVPKVREFLAFALSREGQEIVARHAHFFPLSAADAASERAKLAGYLPPLDPALPAYAAPAQAVAGPVSSIGSDGMESLMNTWLRAFRVFQPAMRAGAHWEHPGTINGFSALIAGETDLAPMGRELWPAEKLTYGRKYPGRLPLEICVARGGHATNGRTETIAIAVNAANPLSSLTLAQLDAIFGRDRRGGAPAPLTRWGQLGLGGEWADRPISVSVPPRVTPHATWFQEKVLRDGPWSRAIHEATPADNIAAVARDPGAIALVFFEELAPGTRAVPLAAQDGAEAFPGTPETIATRRYPLIRSMFIRLNRAPHEALAPHVREFLRFILSREGQEFVRTSGYFPLTAAEAATEREKLD